MIVQSIRLKNIKSYGEGRDGTGVTVTFQPGVNCVAGLNGHGKTTLVEALGYALFLTKPEFEERFNLNTYFVRSGESAGEIDVTFLHHGESYRIERGLGPQSERRSKVVLVSDESTCALDEAEVSAFLCRLLGFKGHEQLTELFSKMIGVKQGRLTWPFDSKPSAAKEYFEPLLEVVVFRETADRLGEAQRRFMALEGEQNVKLAALDERIRDRADCSEKLAACEKRVIDIEKQHRASTLAIQRCEEVQRLHEQKEAALNAADNRLKDARNSLQLAAQAKATEQARMTESAQAADIVKRAALGFEVYQKAEQRSRELQGKQQERSSLQRLRAETLNTRTASESRAEAARRQAKDCASEQNKRTSQAQALKQNLETVRQSLDQGQAAFEALSQSTAAAKTAWGSLQTWSQRLAGEVQKNQTRCEEVLKDWERIQAFAPETLEQARREEQRLEAITQDLAAKLARIEQAREDLAAQLKQIAGGVCPFLREQCRQFDPAKVQADVGAQEKELSQVRARHRESGTALETARRNARELAKQEAGLAELKIALGKRIVSLLDDHCRLLPPTTRNDLNVIETRLGSPCLFASLHQFDTTGVAKCWDLSRAVLEPRLLQSLAQSEIEFLQTVSNSLQSSSAEVNQLFLQFEKTQASRIQAQQQSADDQKNLERIEKEAQDLGIKAAQLNTEAAADEAKVSAANAQLIELDGKLSAFATVDQDFQAQIDLKDKHARDHKEYLGAKPLAERLTASQEALKQATERELEAQTLQKSGEAAFQQAARDFDPTALNQAREATSAARTSLAIAQRAATEAQRELRAERERFAQWETACREGERIAREVGRLNAASGLAKFAGGVLKASAPAVAQNLCNRIAAAAQGLFNRINHEPVELQWHAEPQYGLRVVPSDRRFAMLSGGEQTKLAVAMTLAMLQHFSSLRFAVFDEPTYAVDAESRPKLAEAILEAQKAAGLDQLIIVSHDNSFEGKIEHVIEVRKTAATGTEVVIGA